MPLKLPSSAASNMFGMRRPGSDSSGTPPRLFELAPDERIRDVPVAAELVRERPHVARTLHVVLPAQRVDADAFPAEVAGRHRQLRDRHDHRRSLAVLGDAKAVIDRAVSRRRIEARRFAHQIRIDSGGGGRRLRRVALFRDERLPLHVGVDFAARVDVILAGQPLGHDDVREGVEQRDVRPRLDLKMVVGLDVRRPDQADFARIDDDQAGRPHAAGV